MIKLTFIGTKTAHSRNYIIKMYLNLLFLFIYIYIYITILLHIFLSILFLFLLHNEYLFFYYH